MSRTGELQITILFCVSALFNNFLRALSLPLYVSPSDQQSLIWLIIGSPSVIYPHPSVIVTNETIRDGEMPLHYRYPEWNLGRHWWKVPPLISTSFLFSLPSCILTLTVWDIWSQSWSSPPSSRSVICNRVHCSSYVRQMKINMSNSSPAGHWSHSRCSDLIGWLDQVSRWDSVAPSLIGGYVWWYTALLPVVDNISMLMRSRLLYLSVLGRELRAPTIESKEEADEEDGTHWDRL